MQRQATQETVAEALREEAWSASTASRPYHPIYDGLSRVKSSGS